MKKRKKGFTLVELLAVIALLAILSIIIVPNIIKLYKKSKDNTLVTQSQTLINAAKSQYVLDTKNAISKDMYYCYDGGDKTHALDVKGNDNIHYVISGAKSNIEEILVCDRGSCIYYTNTSQSIKAKEINAELIVRKGEEGFERVDCTQASIPETTDFSIDPWSTIKSNIQAGKTYEVGATRCVDLNENDDGFTTTNNNGCPEGQFLIRVANNSNYDCTLESKTACGLVIEFVDIITTHNMNSTRTNVGGWKDSELRTYLNTTIFNALPNDLKAEGIIADTTVVSGHLSASGEETFTTTDKLYLLSAHEMYEEGTIIISLSDPAWNTTRQLDYYRINSTTTDSSLAIKQYNGNNAYWWLRTALSTDYFYNIFANGIVGSTFATTNSGLSPAFRISYE